jgi:hypothetical protein
MEAISHAGAAVGVLSQEGVVLAAEKKIISKLLETSKSTEKMYAIDRHLACAVAVGPVVYLSRTCEHSLLVGNYCRRKYFDWSRENNSAAIFLYLSRAHSS